MSIPNFIEYFLEFRNVPEEWKDAQNFLNWYLAQAINLVNAKTIGLYSPSEIPCGKQIAQGQGSIDALRKYVDFGGLPNNTTKSVAHGIPVDNTFRILNLYLAANDVSGMKYFCLKYYSIDAADSIRLNMDATNINVITTGDYSAYTDCKVVMEYTRGAI